MHGHAASLNDKVDVIFIPRMVSFFKNETFCPKFLGLPEMVQYSVEGIPRILAPKIELKKGIWQIYQVLLRIGKQLGSNNLQLSSAITAAYTALYKYNSLLNKGYFPAQAMAILEGKNSTQRVSKERAFFDLAVLGYPYQVYDNYITVNMLEILQKMGAYIWTCEMIPNNILNKYRNVLPKELFWYYSNLVIRSTYYYLREKQVDGIIHVSAFGCGPDAIVDKLMELEAKAHKIPFLTLTIDEHTGEAGIMTRLEAFVDMLRIRRGIR